MIDKIGKKKQFSMGSKIFWPPAIATSAGAAIVSPAFSKYFSTIFFFFFC